MVRRHELTDVWWRKSEPLLRGNGRPGGQWADHRRVINGVLFRARPGVPWPDLPERYGPSQTVYERPRRWSADGTWNAVLHELQIEADAGDPDGALDCIFNGTLTVAAIVIWLRETVRAPSETA